MTEGILLNVQLTSQLVQLSSRKQLEKAANLLLRKQEQGDFELSPSIVANVGHAVAHVAKQKFGAVVAAQLIKLIKLTSLEGELAAALVERTDFGAALCVILEQSLYSLARVSSSTQQLDAVNIIIDAIENYANAPFPGSNVKKGNSLIAFPAIPALVKLLVQPLKHKEGISVYQNAAFTLDILIHKIGDHAATVLKNTARLCSKLFAHVLPACGSIVLQVDLLQILLFAVCHDAVSTPLLSSMPMNFTTHVYKAAERFQFDPPPVDELLKLARLLNSGYEADATVYSVHADETACGGVLEKSKWAHFGLLGITVSLGIVNDADQPEFVTFPYEFVTHASCVVSDETSIEVNFTFEDTWEPLSSNNEDCSNFRQGFDASKSLMLVCKPSDMRRLPAVAPLVYAQLSRTGIVLPQEDAPCSQQDEKRKVSWGGKVGYSALDLKHSSHTPGTAEGKKLLASSLKKKAVGGNMACVKTPTPRSGSQHAAMPTGRKQPVRGARPAPGTLAEDIFPTKVTPPRVVSPASSDFEISEDKDDWLVKMAAKAKDSPRSPLYADTESDDNDDGIVIAHTKQPAPDDRDAPRMFRASDKEKNNHFLLGSPDLEDDELPLAQDMTRWETSPSPYRKASGAARQKKAVAPSALKKTGPLRLGAVVKKSAPPRKAKVAFQLSPDSFDDEEENSPSPSHSHLAQQRPRLSIIPKKRASHDRGLESNFGRHLQSLLNPKKQKEVDSSFPHSKRVKPEPLKNCNSFHGVMKEDGRLSQLDEPPVFGLVDQPKVSSHKKRHAAVLDDNAGDDYDAGEMGMAKLKAAIEQVFSARKRSAKRKTQSLWDGYMETARSMLESTGQKVTDGHEFALSEVQNAIAVALQELASSESEIHAAANKVKAAMKTRCQQHLDLYETVLSKVEEAEAMLVKIGAAGQEEIEKALSKTKQLRKSTMAHMARLEQEAETMPELCHFLKPFLG